LLTVKGRAQIKGVSERC